MHRIGRILVSLSRQADLLPQDSAHTNAAERLILRDAVLFPGSTIREIVERTGFTQGYVSKCVADLVKQGPRITVADERDLIAEHVGNPRAGERAPQLLDELEECLL
jgi:DNA-binding MarR family transcriptional regulator